MMTLIFGTTVQTLGGDPFQNVNGFLHQVNQSRPHWCSFANTVLLLLFST